jgi:hypothetical protein
MAAANTRAYYSTHLFVHCSVFVNQKPLKLVYSDYIFKGQTEKMAQESLFFIQFLVYKCFFSHDSYLFLCLCHPGVTH